MIHGLNDDTELSHRFTKKACDMPELGSFEDVDAAMLLNQLNECDEHSRCEAKKSHYMGNSILETVCAFANEPHLGGGYLILGVAKEDKSTLWPTYEVVGIDDPDKFQSDLACQCRQMFNRPIRPKIKLETINKKIVAIIFIPELPRTEKPLYFVADGLPSGAFRRVGSTDQRCSEDDLIDFYGSHQFDTFDGHVVSDCSMDDIDPDAIAQYRKLRHKISSNAPELQSSDEDLLRAIGCMKHNEKTILTPTVAGLLLFGKKLSLRRLFPMMRIDYLRIKDRKWVENPDSTLETFEIREPLIMAIPKLCNLIMSDVPVLFRVRDSDIQREEKQGMPERVVREVVVNALMHRCYRTHSPVSILKYPNRIEIRNPGHSLVSEERLGQPGSVPRNPVIAAVLLDIGFAETKGYGIKLMRELMQTSNLSVPVLESDRSGNRFVAILLLHHFWTTEDIEWLRPFAGFDLSDAERHSLIAIRELGAIDLAIYKSLNGVDGQSATASLRKMCSAGLLQIKGKGDRIYYRPAPLMLAPPKTEGSDVKTEGSQSKTEGLVAKTEGLEDADDINKLEILPHYLQKLADELPAKAGPKRMRRIILALCKWRDLKATEIAAYCNRQSVAHLRSHINELLEEQLLGLTGNKSSPHLRYQTLPLGADWLRHDGSGGLPPIQ